MRRGYDGVVLAAPVTIPYARFSIQPTHWWIGRALRELLRTTNLPKAALDGLAVSSFSLGADTAVGLTQHFGLSPRWLDHVPMGGASALVATRRAARAVQTGDADIVAVVAGDTATPDSFRQQLTAFSRFATDATYPYGAGGPNAMFALITQAYMQRYGATREDFAKICVTQRRNALANPHALMKTPLTTEQYLAARPIADPIALFDCVMPCAGAEAFLVMRESTARAAHLPHAHLRAAIERHHAFPDDPVQLRTGAAQDQAELWAMAAATPAAISCTQTYDDYPVIVMIQMEDLGLCAKGEGKDFVRQHDLSATGSFPHNTSGGQLSTGQAGAAGGHLGVVEALRQLTRQPLGHQVPNASRALVSGFGMINYDRGLCAAAAILEAA